MATPENGTVTFVGDSKKVYSVDAYLSDVLAAPCTFNPNGAAVSSSLTFWKLPENCTLTDISWATGYGAITSLIAKADDAIVPGRVFRLANFLNTLATRPTIGLRLPAGTNFGLLQA